MGLGPSTKMTTLHHYNCPAARTLLKDPNICFCGILVDGVSELYDDKIENAVKTAELASKLKTDGALVSIDGWGNHHIDFVNVIEQLEMQNIPVTGLSYIGQQGRLVCSNPYVRRIIDFNKCSFGYESCVVGQNNLTETDAWKALGLLKHRIRTEVQDSPDTGSLLSLTRSKLKVTSVICADKIRLRPHPASHAGYTLLLSMEQLYHEVSSLKRIAEVSISVLSPRQKDVFVNSNLDFQPIAWKNGEPLGTGTTWLLEGITVMLTGSEEHSGFQPSNIGSSEGILKNQVIFDQAGTPASTDYLLHIDCTFKEGEGRSAEGIMEAHEVCDRILNEIRRELRACTAGFSGSFPLSRENFIWNPCLKKPRIALIKLVSGLGYMYDTSIRPDNPGGYSGSVLMRKQHNAPVCLTPTECLDGAIHSLL